MHSPKARFIGRDKALFRSTPVRAVKPSSGPAICSRCHAVWRKGTWSLAPTVYRAACRWPSPASVVCPACRLTKEQNPVGILQLAGTFLQQNRSEILRLVRNVERAAAAKNPLERIIRIQETDPDELVVGTTSEKLSCRLGRAVNRACGGSLRIRFSHADKFVRVFWRRDVGRSAA